jgi:tRNA(fMet)-specific endonuclease VapC
MRTLVDTDIWSEIFKGKNATVLARAAAYLSQHGRFTLTAVTVFEVIQGLQRVQRASRIDAFREMLEDIEVLELDQECADLAAAIYGELERRGRGIDAGDAVGRAVQKARVTQYSGRRFACAMASTSVRSECISNAMTYGKRLTTALRMLSGAAEVPGQI